MSINNCALLYNDFMYFFFQNNHGSYMTSPGGTTVRQVISRARLGQNGPAVTVSQGSRVPAPAAPVPPSEPSEPEPLVLMSTNNLLQYGVCGFPTSSFVLLFFLNTFMDAQKMD